MGEVARNGVPARSCKIGGAGAGHHVRKPGSAEVCCMPWVLVGGISPRSHGPAMPGRWFTHCHFNDNPICHLSLPALPCPWCPPRQLRVPAAG